MILGRPTQLWTGLATALTGALSAALLLAGVDPATVAIIVSAIAGVLGAIIILVAYQPPTLRVDDKFIIQTPKGEPNYVATVEEPPAPTFPEPDPGPA